MKNKFNFTLTGFILGMLIISMLSLSLALIISDIETEYSLSSNLSFGKYNVTSELRERSQQIRNATDIKQSTNWIDVVGGFFGAGWETIKLAGKSVDLFVGSGGLMDQATQDVPILSFFKDNIITFILIAIFIGVFISALLKWPI